MALSRDDRAEAHDRGARAQALHMLQGDPRPRAPWGHGARRSFYYRRGAARMAAAIAAVLELEP